MTGESALSQKAKFILSKTQRAAIVENNASFNPSAQLRKGKPLVLIGVTSAKHLGCVFLPNYF